MSRSFAQTVCRRFLFWLLATFSIVLVVQLGVSSVLAIKNARINAIKGISTLSKYMIRDYAFGDYRSIWAQLSKSGLFEQRSLFVCTPEGQLLARSPESVNASDEACAKGPASSFEVIPEGTSGPLFVIRGDLVISFFPALTATLLTLLASLVISLILISMAFMRLQFLLQSQLEMLTLSLAPLFEGKGDDERVTADLFTEIRATALKIQNLCRRTLRLQQLEIEAKNQRTNFEKARALAHDLRAPIALLKSIEPEIRTQAPASLDLFSLATHRLTALAKTLSIQPSSASIEAPDLKPMDETLRESIQMIRICPELSRVEIRLLREDRRLWPAADVLNLSRIAINLIHNAIESYDPDEPGQVVLVSTHSQVSQVGDGIVLEVQDFGRGMYPEIAEQAIGGSFTTKRDGQGLGLSTARTWAENRGGSFKLETKFGEGTKVRIEIPFLTEGNLAASHGVSL